MKIRSLMPDLSGDELIVNEREIRDEPNKVTLVYFWSISCKQCEDSLPNLRELAQHFEGQLTVISIHMPRSAEDHNLEPIKQQLKRFGISFPVYIDRQLRLTDLFGNRFVPAYYLFDEQKKLRFYQGGYINKKNLKQKIERLI